MYKQLIQTAKLRQLLEDEIKVKKNKFEETIKLEVASLEDLKTQEQQLREEAILQLEKDKQDNIAVDDKLIIRQVRQTKQIIDPNKLRDALGDQQKELADIGINAIEIMSDNFEKQMIIKDKKLMLDVIDKYEKVEGKVLDGVEIKQTKFLTIKNI